MISYTISMPEPHTHLFFVTIEVDAVADRTLDLALPVWTPGSYMVRDFARHVQSFAASAGQQQLEWRKADKSTWRVTTGGAGHITVSYQVYAFELSVRTSYLDGQRAAFTPATLCMYVPDRTDEPLAMHVVAPPEWRVSTGLDLAEETTGTVRELTGLNHGTHFFVRRSTFRADDYDHLVDAPFFCGEHRLLTFEVDGIPHEIALDGRGNQDEQRILADTQRIVETTRNLFGALPYQRYVFLVTLTDGLYGGLEHRNSVWNTYPRWEFQPPRAYERFLALTSHEFYHVWNVKRVRPAPLGPFDYSRENYTRNLWVAEGITSYYDNLILARAGLATPERYLEWLAEEIKQLQSQPGRALQSLEQSSFDTWIKLYRPDENSINSSISYYLKGGLVALLLDLEIRHQTGGQRSLDDVMRLLYSEFEQSGSGFAEEFGFLAAVEAVAGTADGRYRDLFERYVAGTDELDFERGFALAGLRLEWSHGEARSEAVPAWHGLVLKTEHGRLLVKAVRSNGPANAAGIYAGDQIIAFDGTRVDEERLKARMAERRPGDTATLSLFRRDDLLHIPLTLTAAPPDTLKILPLPERTPQQLEVYQAWMGMPASQSEPQLG
jgi:predicted metalloprotease with PDZ domain